MNTPAAHKPQNTAPNEADPDLRIIALPGCHLQAVHAAWTPWLQTHAPDIKIQFLLDANLEQSPDDTPTLVLLRYPLDQLAAWFDERCAHQPPLDQPNQWVSHAMSAASVWQRFFRRWFIDQPNRTIALDYNQLFQSPDELVDVLKAFLNLSQETDLPDIAAPEASHWEWGPGFRYFGPGFAVTLKGLFAGCPWIDQAHDQLNLFSGPSTAPGVPSVDTTKASAQHGGPEELSRFEGTPTVVLTVGKVGSKTVYRPLADRLKTPVYDIHMVRNPIPADDPTLCDENGGLTIQGEHMQAVYQTIVEPGHPARYISPVREPMARNISAMFQAYEKHTIDLPQRFNAEQIADHLIEEFMGVESHHQTLNWFTTELTEVTGIDPTQEPFDHQRGYRWYTSDHAAVLIYRCEDPGRIQTKAIEQFLGLTQLRFQRLHKTKDKPFAAVYAQFVKRFRPTQTMLDALYQHPVTQTFYTAEEIDGFYRRWQATAIVTQAQPLATGTAQGID